MRIKVLGIDLAKNVFQLCAISQAGREFFNRQVRRAKLSSTISNRQPDLIAMEACSSAHYWVRRFKAMGHRVALIPAQHVKAFVRVNKSDAHDALAIAEASQRARIKTVPVNSLEQQDLQMISRQRQRWIRHRTAVVNQIRSTGREYGVSILLGYRALNLVPRHTETGGRTRMLCIGKNRHQELRTMMIHGARAVIR